MADRTELLSQIVEGVIRTVKRCTSVHDHVRVVRLTSIETGARLYVGSDPNEDFAGLGHGGSIDLSREQVRALAAQLTAMAAEARGGAEGAA